MHNTRARLGFFVSPFPNRASIFFLVALVLISAAAYAVRFRQASPGGALPAGTVAISQAALEEHYGLRVSLIAVTAVGGFVDVRLKILDGEKARLLLEDSGNFPSLRAEDNPALYVPEESKKEEIRFEDNSSLFLMFPNAGNAIQPGTQVKILFGDLVLEPVEAQ